MEKEINDSASIPRFRGASSAVAIYLGELNLEDVHIFPGYVP